MRIGIGLGGLLLAIGAACGGDQPVKPTGPVAGDFIVALSTPGTADGAVLLSILGGPASQVSAVSSYQVASASAGVNLMRVVVTGPIAGGDLLKFHVPDVAAVGSYSIRIEAVADRNTFALVDPVVYSATVRR